MKDRLTVLLLFAFALIGTTLAAPRCMAQRESTSETGKSVMQNLADAPLDIPGTQDAKRAQTMAIPNAWCAEVEDAVTRDVCWKAYRAGFEYHMRGLEHRSRVFWWQHYSGRVLFLVVNALVFIGLAFAWVQFRRDMTADPAVSPPGAHEISVQSTGVTIRSSVLGVIILGLSLAFFYLYLVYVYPLVELL